MNEIAQMDEKNILLNRKVQTNHFSQNYRAADQHSPNGLPDSPSTQCSLRSSFLILPHIVDRKLQRVVRCRKIHVVPFFIRLLQLALFVQLIFEELILVFCYACVDEDVVDRAKPLDAVFESFALAVPVGELALQGENAVGIDE